MASKYYRVLFEVDGKGMAESRPVVLSEDQFGEVRGLSAVADPGGVEVWIEAPVRWTGLSEMAGVEYLAALGVRAETWHAIEADAATRDRKKLSRQALKVLETVADPEGRWVLVTASGTVTEAVVLSMLSNVNRHLGPKVSTSRVDVVGEERRPDRIFRTIEMRVGLTDKEVRSDEAVLEKVIDKCLEVHGVRSQIRTGKMAVEGSVRGAKST